MLHDWKRMLNRHPRFVEIHCRRGGRSGGRKSHLTVRLSRLRDGRWSGIVQTVNTVRHTKYGRIRGLVVGEGGRSTGVLLYLRCAAFLFSAGCEVERKLFLPATPLHCRVTCSKRHSWWWSECFHTVGSYRVDTMSY